MSEPDGGDDVVSRREGLEGLGAHRGAREPQAASGVPSGDLYDWYRRGSALLERGDAAAAAEVLRHARRAAPGSASVHEALARALFDSGRHAEAADAFRELAGLRPDDDYARFGLGLSLTRLDRFEEAVEQLSLAVAMRPERGDYMRALAQARATLRARGEQV